MAHQEHNPLDHADVASASLGFHITAFVIGMVAMAAACFVTVGVELPRHNTLMWISALAAIAGLSQLYLMFKLDLSEARRWHTISLLLTIPLFFMSIGLTIWMFDHLATRTMLMGG